MITSVVGRGNKLECFPKCRKACCKQAQQGSGVVSGQQGNGNSMAQPKRIESKRVNKQSHYRSDWTSTRPNGQVAKLQDACNWDFNCVGE